MDTNETVSYPGFELRHAGDDTEVKGELAIYHDFDADIPIGGDYDPRGVAVNVTHEGIILDAYDLNGEAWMGTRGFTWDELWEWLAR